MATASAPTLFEEVRDRLVQSSIQTGVATSVQIITEDLRWKDALKQGVINTGVSSFGALGANKLSLLYNGGKGSWNYAAHKLGHFALGGVMGAASNYKDPFKGFLSGCAGGMCAEVIMEGLPSTMRMSDSSRLTRALIGTGTFLAGGNVTITDLTATNAIENNSFFVIARLAVQAARTAPALERALGATTGLGLGLVAGEYVNEAIGEYTNEATGEYTNDNGSSNSASASQGFFSALQGFVSGVNDELNGGLPQFRTPQRQSTMDEAPIRPITTGGFDVWDTLPGIFSTPIPTYQPTQPGFDLWDGHLQQMTTPIPDNLPDLSVLTQKNMTDHHFETTDNIKLTESGRMYGSHKDLIKRKAKDSHHVIQDAAVKKIPGYKKSNAPAIQLAGPASKKGTEHYNATQEQRRAGGGDYGFERKMGYRALRKAGMSKNEARQQIKLADEYFSDLGVNKNTPTRIPGNRKGKKVVNNDTQ